MRKKIVTLALAGGLSLTGAAVAVPGIAAAADSSTTAAADRVTSLKSALKGLVTSGTITQAQADKVATTLADTLPPGGRHGHGPRGGHLSPEAVAKVLGVTVEELRTAHDAGKTLAQIAAAEGMSKADLITGLVAAAKAQLAADVKAGTVTQAQADAMSADLTARITEKVDRVHTGQGHRGPPPADATAAPSA